MKKKYYWKIVRIVSKSKYVSMSVCDSDYVIEYSVGKKSTPNIGKIFVFNTRQNARRYRRNMVKGRYKILKVKVTGTPIPVVFRAFVDDTSIKKYWEHRFDQLVAPMDTPSDEIVAAPDGTYLAESVTPIEVSR